MKIIGKITTKLVVSVGIGIFIGGFGIAAAGTAFGIGGVIGGAAIAYVAISAFENISGEVLDMYDEYLGDTISGLLKKWF